MLVVKIKLNTEMYKEETPLLHCRSYQFGVVLPVNTINADTHTQTQFLPSFFFFFFF